MYFLILPTTYILSYRKHFFLSFPEFSTMFHMDSRQKFRAIWCHYTKTTNYILRAPLGLSKIWKVDI